MDDIQQHILGIIECAKAGQNAAPADSDVDPASDEEEPAQRSEGPETSSSEAATEKNDVDQNQVEKRILIDITKANDEEQTITGVVLQPEVVDAHGDIMSKEVIKETAFRFLMNFNVKTKLGVQHSAFPKGKMALVESYIAPMNFALGVKTVKEGSWIMTVKVLDKALWKKVKDGKITGFSIGGKAKVIAA